MKHKEMKSVLVSIKPEYCEKIFHEIGWCMPSAKGKKIYEKRIEVRKSKPNEVPFKAYIYCTGGKLLFKSTDGNLYTSKYFNYNRQEDAFNCKVIGEFVCDKIVKYDYQVIACAKYEVNGAYVKEELRYNAGACLTSEEMFFYSKGKPLYGWHISELKIYDKPKELSEFRPICKFEGKDAICALFCLNWKYDGGLFFECTRKVTRPPKSWCYVEEI